MELPKMRQPAVSRQTVEAFRGYNHNLRIGDGEFYEMQNMTSDRYPVLSPRGQRGVYAEPDLPTGLIAKDSLCYVDGADFITNKYKAEMKLKTQCDTCENKMTCSAYEEGKTVCRKQLISMGAYVIILPDKKYFNTMKDGDWGDIEASFTSMDDVTFSLCTVDGEDYGTVPYDDTPPDPKVSPLWIDTSSSPHVLKKYSETGAMWVSIASTYIKISCTGIGAAFNQYDGVTISGIKAQALQDLNAAAVIWDKGENYIVVAGILDTLTKQPVVDGAIKVERKMPNMDFVIESGNRLWGCRYGVAANGQVVNEIYCSKLGDFKNWSCSMGISTDSWVAGCGTDGPFTGAITHLGYPLFFKETCVHKVYGSYPANFQIQTTPCNGVQKGCHNSLAIVNTNLFYKSGSGVYAYDGSLPVNISYALGSEAYSEAAGGALGNKYYISMKDSAGAWHLFVYDTEKQMWHREDDLQVESFCACRGDLYAISGGKIITMLGSGTPDTAPVEWMVQTGDIGISSPDMKYISRLTLRLAMDMGAEVRVYGQYDFSQEWEQMCVITSDSFRSFSIPIRPKRCDRMRLRIEGVGGVHIYSVTKTVEQGGAQL